MGIITCSYSDPEGEPMLEMQIGVPGTRYLKGLFWLTGLIAAAWLLAGWVVGGESTKLALAGLVLVSGAVAVTILNNWRSGIYLFLVWLLFEDLVRKYLGNNCLFSFGLGFYRSSTPIHRASGTACWASNCTSTTCPSCSWDTPCFAQRWISIGCWC